MVQKIHVMEEGEGVLLLGVLVGLLEVEVGVEWVFYL